MQRVAPEAVDDLPLLAQHFLQKFARRFGRPAQRLAFGVLDTHNRIVWTIGDFLFRVTDPVLRPIRSVLPNFGSIDISPLIVLAVIQLAVLPLLQRLQLALATGVWQALIN